MQHRLPWGWLLAFTDVYKKLFWYHFNQQWKRKKLSKWANIKEKSLGKWQSQAFFFWNSLGTVQQSQSIRSALVKEYRTLLLCFCRVKQNDSPHGTRKQRGEGPGSSYALQRHTLTEDLYPLSCVIFLYFYSKVWFFSPSCFYKNICEIISFKSKPTQRTITFTLM
jgi:hypothetical protein